MTQALQPGNQLLAGLGTTIFTVMSALAVQHNAINLGQGFPDTEGPRDVVEAAAAALLDGQNQYPPLAGVLALRQAVAAINRRFYGLEIDSATEVVVTSGGTEGLTAALIAVLNPGDEVVLFEPLYDTYLPVIRLLGAVPRIVRLNPPDWALPEAALRAAFGPRTKAVLINTPMNPTGKLFTPAELGLLAELLEQHNAYAICDEVYEHLAFDGAQHLPLMALPGMRERCLRVGSAGKTFSLTGWKLGYVTATARLSSLVAKAHQNLTFTSPPNLQRAVAYGLGKDEEFFTALGTGLGRKCARLREGLIAAGLPCLGASGGYFLIADISRTGMDDEEFCRRMTLEAQVTAIPLSAFYDQPDPPRHLVRFAFCKLDQVLDEAAGRLAVWLQNLVDERRSKP